MEKTKKYNLRNRKRESSSQEEGERTPNKRSSTVGERNDETDCGDRACNISEIIDEELPATAPCRTTRSPSIRGDFKTIPTPLTGSVAVCCVDENTMWIGDCFNNTNNKSALLKVKLDLERSRKVSPVKEYSFSDVDFYDFHYDFGSDKLFYTSRSRNAVIALDSDYNEETVIDTSPLKPTGINVNGNIYIGMVHDYGYMENEYGSRKIVKLKLDGTKILEIDGKALFTIPHRIVINRVNEDIIVVDAISPKNGAILILDSGGSLKGKHVGESSGQSFKPNCVTCSEGGDIICANENNGNIHILDSKGYCLRIVVRGSSDNQIYGIPYSISWDFTGRLVFGLQQHPHGQAHIQFSDYIADTEL